MIFASKEDVSRCTLIVKEQLGKRGVGVADDIFKKITEDIMNISYSKGGDYSDKIIRSFAETYIEEGFYEKYLR